MEVNFVSILASNLYLRDCFLKLLIHDGPSSGYGMEKVDVRYGSISEYVEGIGAVEVHMGIPVIWRNTLGLTDAIFKVWNVKKFYTRHVNWAPSYLAACAVTSVLINSLGSSLAHSTHLPTHLPTLFLAIDLWVRMPLSASVPDIPFSLFICASVRPSCQPLYVHFVDAALRIVSFR